MKRITVKELFASPESCSGKEITVAGWCRAIRANNNFGFIDLNDGSTLPCLQVVFEAEKLGNYKEIAKQNVGASVAVKGIFELTPGAKQAFELKATEIEVTGTSTPDFRFRKSVIPMNFSAQLPTSGRGQTSTRRCSGYARSPLMPSISSFRRETSSMSTLR